MPRGLKVSSSVIVNLILFVNISNFLKQKIIHIMIFNIANLDTWNDSFSF